MSPVDVTLKRTVQQIRSTLTTIFATFGFLAATSALFAYLFVKSEGTRIFPASLWALAVSFVLPLYVSILAMDVWSAERRTGRIELLLTAPVREFQLVVGKFFGVFFIVSFGVLLSLAVTLLSLLIFVPNILLVFPPAGFVSGLLILLLQGALWCAVALAISATTSSPAWSAFLSILVSAILPRGIWTALLMFSSKGSAGLGEYPLDSIVYDSAAGIFSSGVVIAHLLCSCMFLFITTQILGLLRLVGNRKRWARMKSYLVIGLAIAVAVLASLLAFRLDFPLTFPLSKFQETSFTSRTRSILSESQGEIRVSVFLRRKDPRFRMVSHFVRSLARESESLGGARFVVSYVDPLLDFSQSGRLIRQGVPEESLYLERGARKEILSLRKGFDERLFASAVLRLARSSTQSCLYWTVGHGELRLDDYSAWGLSEIARDIQMDGYVNRQIDLSTDAPLPSDCALVVVAGAKKEFTRHEMTRLEAYLRRGGRLLVLMSSPVSGLSPLLPPLGLRIYEPTLDSASATLSGGDVMTSQFSQHPIVAQLEGERVVFDSGVAFTPSSVATEETKYVNRTVFEPLVKFGDACLVALIERGKSVGSDIAFRPMRIIAIGDSLFVSNGQMATRANANRDFFLNCVSYLAGAELFTAGESQSSALVAGFDRRSARHFVIGSTFVIPGVVLLFSLLLHAFRRRPHAN